MVASPHPLEVLALHSIAMLVEAGAIVICAGGGGIPVARDEHGLRGVPSVIDKDEASALLAVQLGADVFVMCTDQPGVFDHFGKPDAKIIGSTSPEQLRRERFAPGSMGPKVDAATRFVAETGGRAAIGALADAAALVSGRRDRYAGTSRLGAALAGERRSVELLHPLGLEPYVEVPTVVGNRQTRAEETPPVDEVVRRTLYPSSDAAFPVGTHERFGSPAVGWCNAQLGPELTQDFFVGHVEPASKSASRTARLMRSPSVALRSYATATRPNAPIDERGNGAVSNAVKRSGAALARSASISRAARSRAMGCPLIHSSGHALDPQRRVRVTCVAFVDEAPQREMRERAHDVGEYFNAAHHGFTVPERELQAQGRRSILGTKVPIELGCRRGPLVS